MKNVVNQLKALGETNRFRICMMLLEKPLCVCELLSVLDIAGGTLSNHLKILRHAHLVDQRKEGKWVVCHIADEGAEKLIRFAASCMTDTEITDDDHDRICCSSRELCSVTKSPE
ncbi:transcriptional regulator [Oceanispirochaeta crateris]|uniref:Transcriptional regulator n=1 Tax=Oceanispirochaeta crateris TaxID=2518645 RepID=A0A5C1QN78_9SPIO|nr:transcriptional regulator [Oceanispirochaeta crateris]